MAEDTIKLKFTVEAAQAVEAVKKQRSEIERLEKSWNEATDAEKKYAHALTSGSVWRTITTDISKLVEKIGEAHPRVAGLATSFGNVAKGVAVASAAIAAAGVVAVRFMADAEKQENAIRRLGDAYDAVSAQTNGAISAQQALTLQGQLQTAGVRVSAQQLGLLTRAAREYALATGNDASQAVEKLTNAIVNNSEDALSELNLAQARSTSSTQTLANMTRELENRFRGVTPAARTLNEDLEKLPGVMTYIGNAAAQAAAGGLRSFIDMLHGAQCTGLWRP